MDTAIKTTTYEEAIKAALNMGFGFAWRIDKGTLPLEKMLKDQQAAFPDDTATDWIVIGDVLGRLSDAWKVGSDVYYLH